MAVHPHIVGGFYKLREIANLRFNTVKVLDYLLSGKYKGCKLTVVGEYGDQSLFGRAVSFAFSEYKDEQTRIANERLGKPLHKYIVNLDKKVYIDTDLCTSILHPLPILCSVGNGLGYGDYEGPNDLMALAGTWAGDRIEVTDKKPSTIYNKVDIDFII